MKYFVSPLILIFIFLFGLALVAYRSRKEVASGLRSRLALLGGFVFGTFLYLPATPAGSQWLRQTLAGRTAERPSAWEPRWIVVLSGGIVRGVDADRTVLSSETAQRVAHAAVLAAQYPQAGLIFSGGLAKPVGLSGIWPHDLAVRQMQEIAVARGVSASRCLLEGESRNTAAHPAAVAALPEVNPADAILVVTSDWHIPRAKMVFDQIFTDAYYDGSVFVPRPLPGLRRWIPSEEALAATALYFREWVGRGWYWVRS